MGGYICHGAQLKVRGQLCEARALLHFYTGSGDQNEATRRLKQALQQLSHTEERSCCIAMIECYGVLNHPCLQDQAG